MTYHLAESLPTPVGLFPAGLQVWVVGRKGDTMTINLLPPPFAESTITVHRTALTYRITPKDRATSRCGTYSGYTGHRRRHEIPCDACTTAQRRYCQAQRLRLGETTKVPVDAAVLAELYLNVPLEVQCQIDDAVGADVIAAACEYADHLDRGARRDVG